MKPLHRRTVLRATGIALGLPLLEAMLDRRGRLQGAHAAGAPPVRLVWVTYPDGIQGPRTSDPATLSLWTPATDGAGYALTPSLKGLAPVKDDVTVLSRVRNSAFYVRGAFASECHPYGMGTLLTGVPLTAKGAGGPSVDQIAARELGQGTRFASLQLAAHMGGGSRPHNKYASWAGREQPNPPMLDPAAAFARLFGKAPDTVTGVEPAADPVARYRRSVLDYVRADITRLGATLGAGDRTRLDAHLEGIRALEREIAAVPAPGTAGGACQPTAPDASSDYPARLNAMFKLTVTALACDLTRFVVLQYSQALSYLQYPWLGIRYQNHSVSHEDNGGTPNAAENYARITAWKVEQFGKLVLMMKDVPEAGGTLLDNALVLFCSDSGTGTGHQNNHLALLLAGRGGGKVTPGRHLRLPAKLPLNRVHLTMLRLAGSRAATFGMDGDEPVALG